jgi:dihydroorotate dehydrogenase electron transfer subunit
MYDEIVAVTENRPLTGGHFLLSVKSPRQAKAIRPGQFAMLRLLGRSDVLLRRPMSIYDVKLLSGRRGKHKAERSLEIIQFLYKVVGRGTKLMAQLQPMAKLKPGDHLGLLAPLGHGFFAEEYLPHAKAADEILHVAGGIGIAALLLPARELARQGFRQRLFFGGKTKADLVGVEEFKPLIRSMVFATEDGSHGRQGFVTKLLEQYMACGPWAMLEATVALARQYQYPCLVSMENRMGCGLGVCLGCSIRVEGTGHGTYQRVCTEGPVFWAEKVVWENASIPRTQE